MDRGQLIERMEEFTARVARMINALPRSPAAKVFGDQVLRSAGSIGANYRESGHVSSRRHFITTLETAQREAGETIYWLRVISKSGLVNPERLTKLIVECEELFAIITAAIRTTKKKP